MPTPPVHCRILKRCRDNDYNVIDFGRVCDISPETICRELIRYSRLNLPPERRLPENPAILQTLLVELLTQLEIPVLAFQESGVYNMHRARCTGTRLFHNKAIRNDWVWIYAGDEHTYCALRGRLPARLIALFKMWSVYMQEDTVCRLSVVQFLRVVDSGRPSDTHSLVTVQL